MQAYIFFVRILWIKAAKNRYKLSASLNFKTLNTILSGTNHIWAAAQILQIRPLVEQNYS